MHLVISCKATYVRCVFSWNLPPALLAEWLGSFTCYCGTTGLERIPKLLKVTDLHVLSCFQCPTIFISRTKVKEDTFTKWVFNKLEKLYYDQLFELMFVQKCKQILLTADSFGSTIHYWRMLLLLQMFWHTWVQEKSGLWYRVLEGLALQGFQSYSGKSQSTLSTEQLLALETRKQHFTQVLVHWKSRDEAAQNIKEFSDAKDWFSVTVPMYLSVANTSEVKNKYTFWTHRIRFQLLNRMHQCFKSICTEQTCICTQHCRIHLQVKAGTNTHTYDRDQNIYTCRLTSLVNYQHIGFSSGFQRFVQGW